MTHGACEWRVVRIYLPLAIRHSLSATFHATNLHTIAPPYFTRKRATRRRLMHEPGDRLGTRSPSRIAALAAGVCQVHAGHTPRRVPPLSARNRRSARPQV